jgi:hypothetical protein
MDVDVPLVIAVGIIMASIFGVLFGLIWLGTRR